MQEKEIVDLCEKIGDCTRCPCVELCKFAGSGCTEAWNCEQCPRLRVCVVERRSGLIKYLEFAYKYEFFFI